MTSLAGEAWAHGPERKKPGPSCVSGPPHQTISVPQPLSCPLAPLHHPLSCPLRAAAGGASIQIQVTLRRGDCFSLSSHSGALQSVASCSADYLLCCDRFFMVFCRFSALLRALESKSFSFIFFVADLFICITLDLMRGGGLSIYFLGVLHV